MHNYTLKLVDKDHTTIAIYDKMLLDILPNNIDLNMDL